MNPAKEKRYYITSRHCGDGKPAWDVKDFNLGESVITCIDDLHKAEYFCAKLNAKIEPMPICEDEEPTITTMTDDQFERLLEVLALSALANAQATVLAQGFLLKNSSTQPIQPSTEKIINNMQAGMNILGARLEVYVKTPLPQ